MTTKDFFKFTWLCENDKKWHLVIGALVGLFFGTAAAASAEFKDWMWNGKKGGPLGWIHGNGFDWLDFLATMIGGIAGSICHHYIVEPLWIF